MSTADEIYYYDRTKEPQRVDPAVLGKMMGTKKEAESAETAQAKEEAFVYDHYTGVVPDHTAGMDNDWNDTLAAIDRIRHPVDPQKPLCLFLGWQNPHPPYAVEKRFYDLIDEGQIADEISTEHLQGKPYMLELYRKLANLEGKSREEWRKLRRVYLAQCAKVDSHV